MNTLFDINAAPQNYGQLGEYSAKDIEVLEGLEPVRRRPGMYIGGTDINALHHLIVEVLDNAMDEAIAGYASFITVHLHRDGSISIADDGRGIPIDPHPKYPDKSALEIIMTTLHSGGKFGGNAYQTAGGLHGVGISVVNALSVWLEVKVRRHGKLYSQRYERGTPQGVLQTEPVQQLGNGTTVTFMPDPEVFPEHKFIPEKVRQLVTAKAYLHKGIHLIWRCDNSLMPNPITQETIEKEYVEEHIQFKNGLSDYLQALAGDHVLLGNLVLAHDTALQNQQGRVEWAIAWLVSNDEGMIRSYCNTIHTPNGGTHEAGFRNGLMRAIRNYAVKIGYKKDVGVLTVEDVLSGVVIIISLFLANPIFQGQTKEKLLNPEAAKLLEAAAYDYMEQWLVVNNALAGTLLDAFFENAELRRKLKQAKEIARKTPVKSLRLPGKLADCINTAAKGSELFIVEGESAGGTAKQARDKIFQAVLPLKGKILNVASNSIEKIKANQEIADLVTALGCGTGGLCKLEQLRYDKVIIMTDADVDGAHIAALLMTFFFLQMPELIRHGHLYLAQPPLYKLKSGNVYHYAHNEREKEAMLIKLKGNIEIGRFKGLGEMNPEQLKATTMAPYSRNLLRVKVEDYNVVREVVEKLMGKKPEHRLRFIQETSKLFGVSDLSKLLDV